MIPSRQRNPFHYRARDRSLDKKIVPQYYPPNKRKEMKEYLGNSNISFNFGNEY